MFFWPTMGDGYLLNTLASVFLGGTSVFGGTGTIFGTFVASYIIALDQSRHRGGRLDGLLDTVDLRFHHRRLGIGASSGAPKILLMERRHESSRTRAAGLDATVEPDRIRIQAFVPPENIVTAGIRKILIQ